jgi:hypothetical protein
MPARGVRRDRRYKRPCYLSQIAGEGRHAEAERIVAEAVVRNRGNLVGASHDLGLGYQGAKKYVTRYELWGVVRDARRRAGAPPSWLVRTLAVIEGGRMEAIRRLYEAAAGMSVEEVEAEVLASMHADAVDARALAEAIVTGAEAMAGGG